MSNLYVSLEEVTELLKNWESITSNCNTIEESFAMLPCQVELLPTINLSEIDKMISEPRHYEAINTLQELRQRLLTKN